MKTTRLVRATGTCLMTTLLACGQGLEEGGDEDVAGLEAMAAPQTQHPEFARKLRDVRDYGRVKKLLQHFSRW